MESIHFRCPSCDQSLRIAADKAGRKVRCVRCRTAVAVPAREDPEDAEEEVPEVAPDRPPGKARRKVETKTSPRETTRDDEEDAPPDETLDAREDAGPQRKKPRGKRRSEEWRLARLGLLLLLIGAAVTIFMQLVAGVPFLAVRSPGAMAAMLGALNVIMWVTGVFTAVGFLTQVAGFGLCIFAPRESGARPAAVAALVCTLLTGAGAILLLWMTTRSLIFTPDTPDVPDMSTEQARKEYQEKLVREMKDGTFEKRMKQQTEDFQRQMEGIQRQARVLQLWNLVIALIQGIYFIAVPILLRTLARAINRKELEPSCDTLLKLGAGLIAVTLLFRFVGVMLIMRLPSLVSFAMGGVYLLTLAWQGVFLLVLYQLWQAMPARR